MSLWPSMFDDACRERIRGRLHRLSPESARRWGRMSAPQMLAHLTDQMRHCLGDVPVTPHRGPLRLPGVKFATLYLLPWPKGRVQGPPEAFVTEPEDWDGDLEVLEELLDRFCGRSPREPWPPHLLFGRMSGRDWGVFCHKHFDHHLRQFGV